jgi:hypothetical protein
VRRFADAWETDDIDGIVALLTNDAWVTMPPATLQYAQAPIAHAAGLIVLTLEGDQISAITTFIDSSVMSRFGLPRTLRD